ncbi:glycosyltransferase family 2 protein [Shewanella baltica]|uniref:Glycosyl transferase, family 2 n=1 Tax=Shewanella baltica (strain OS155 / ATCC BAA-1091) TaxID=325240 RepID=A3D6K4_SHEB5|nr:glycosyltransferase family 2 protein [Shewanella baltica]ABN62367.1 glycosyl transferase, family 2 [Shewanella baltica OS155]AEH14711.1 glycosyl transferase family 2 [Shewanella baltica OS117]
MVKVSVILVSYNTRELTLNAIKSIHEKTKNILYEIILVDNDSCDNTLEQVEKEFQDVICIRNDKNYGFGYANNIGAKKAKGEYIFLLNTDTVLINNAIKILSDYLDTYAVKDNIVAVCGNLYDQCNNPTTSYSKLFPSIALEINTLFFNFMHHLKSKNFHFNFSNKPIQFKGSLSGADSMLVKRHFDSVNGFDQDFFLYYEETDLFYRLIAKGLLVASVPQAKIVHLEGASEQLKEKTLIRSFTSKYLYLKKHKPNYIHAFYHYIYQATLFSRIILFRVLGNNEKLQYWKLLEKIENQVYLESKQ